jgi:hypothetical protein
MNFPTKNTPAPAQSRVLLPTHTQALARCRCHALPPADATAHAWPRPWSPPSPNATGLLRALGPDFAGLLLPPLAIMPCLTLCLSIAPTGLLHRPPRPPGSSTLRRTDRQARTQCSSTCARPDSAAHYAQPLNRLHPAGTWPLHRLGLADTQPLHYLRLVGGPSLVRAVPLQRAAPGRLPDAALFRWLAHPVAPSQTPM